MPNTDLETEENRTDQTNPPITDNNIGNTPGTTTGDENNPAPQPNDTDTPDNGGNPPTTANPVNPPPDPPQVNPAQQNPPEGKFGGNIVDPVILRVDRNGNPENLNERNAFLQQEYVDTYDMEQEYDAANDEQRRILLDEMRAAAQGGGQGNAQGGAPAPGGGAGGAPGGNPGGNPNPAAEGENRSWLAKALQSDALGTLMDITDAASDASTLGVNINSLVKTNRLEEVKQFKDKTDATTEQKQAYDDAEKANDSADKASNINSLVTNTAGLITGGIGTYRDMMDAQKAIRGGNKGDLHSNNLAVAADVFGMGNNLGGIIGSSMGLAGNEKEAGITGLVGDSLGAIGNILSMSGSADKVRRQNNSLDQLKAITDSNTASAEKKTLAKDYSEATKAKRWGSGFETGAGVASTLASITSIVGDSFGLADNNPMSALLGLVGTVIGIVGKGLSWFGGMMENRRKSQNKDSIVDRYVADEMGKVERHGSVAEEGELTNVEKENIAIARMGCRVTDFSKEGQKEAFKDEIFAHIGDIRVEAARHDPELLEIMGLAENASDEVIRDALGYGD